MTRRRIAPADAEWPAQLAELGPADPPVELSLQGTPLPPMERCIAIVGARRATAAGMQAARELGGDLAAAGFTVVSGLAAGIDAAAHRAALDAGGSTVAVLGCGLDVAYPRCNRKLQAEIAARGTLVSEYPDDAPPLAYNFPRRNRIIAGLSCGVVVVEGTYSSGALITARFALDANRAVFAVPGSIRNPLSQGPNELIRTSQAALITSVEHIFEEIAPRLAWSSPYDPGLGDAPEVGDGEQRALELLDDVPMHMDEICKELGLPFGEVALLLSKMEVRGLVAQNRDGYTLADAGARARAAHLGPPPQKSLGG